MNQRRWITREEIAQIYDQLGTIEMRAAQTKIEADPKNADESILDRSFDFYHTGDLIREIEEIKPLIPERVGDFVCLVRSGRNNW